MKALFIGGTGTISTDVVELAQQRGWEITLLNRGSKKLPEGVGSIIADIHDEEAVAKAIADESYDVVAQFIAYTAEDVERDIRLFRNKTKQYIFISSASAYQKPLADYRITESTPLVNPYWQYSRHKIAAEEVLMTAYRTSGFPITIVRPSHTYNGTKPPVSLHGNKGNWQILKRILDGKPVIIPGDGSSLWTLTHSKDFAKGYVGLMANPHAIGNAFHIFENNVYRYFQQNILVGRSQCKSQVCKGAVAAQHSLPAFLRAVTENLHHDNGFPVCLNQGSDGNQQSDRS